MYTTNKSVMPTLTTECKTLLSLCQTQSPPPDTTLPCCNWLENMLYSQLSASRAYAFSPSCDIQTRVLTTPSHPSLLHSRFVPQHIQNYILQQCTGFTLATVTILGLQVRIYMAHLPNETEYSTQAQHISWILHALLSLTGHCKRTAQTLNIFLYPTHFKKSFPLDSCSQNGILSPTNCNSAVTYQCALDGEILIFRREEWCKVLVHELFHSLCFDFPDRTNTKLKELLYQYMSVEGDYRISEAYCEFWATVLNAAVTSWTIQRRASPTPGTLQVFTILYRQCLYNEQLFSIFQATQVLHFMGLTYSEFASPAHQHKVQTHFLEKTNVFAYYIIKMILLVHYEGVCHWCRHHNGCSIFVFENTAKNVESFAQLIQTQYKSKTLHQRVQSAPLSALRQGLDSTPLNRTLRMTICEVYV